MPEPLLIDRPPRIQPELPFDQIDIPNPPEHRESGYDRLVQVALPLVTIIGYVLVSSLGGSARNPWLLVPMALSVVASSALGYFGYRQAQRHRAEQEREYTARLTELARELHLSHDQQRRFYHHNYPDPAATLLIARRAREEAEHPVAALRSGGRLWERRANDSDFGVVRLGIGTRPSTVVYKLGGDEGAQSALARAARKLASDSRFVGDVPVTIALRRPPEPPEGAEAADVDDELRRALQPPVVPSLAVIGERGAAYEFTRALLAHAAIFHAAADLHLYLIGQDRGPWEWAEDLPHTRDSEQGSLLYFDRAPPSLPDSEEGTPREQFLEALRKRLSQRHIRLQEQDEGAKQRGDPTQPHLLVVIDLLAVDPDFATALETDAATTLLMHDGMALGATVIFLVPERSKAPGGCHAVIEVERTTPLTNSRILEQQRLHFRYAEVGVNTPRYVGAADALPLPAEVADVAKKLGELTIRQSSGTSLPTSVPFLELTGSATLEQLRQYAKESWKRSRAKEHAAWMRARIGKMPGNKLRTLTFSARKDGVHGLVAGSTGSGKSELLVALITDMAVSYDPSVVNFVLVDYKGGTAFEPFKKLPHCVDVITNLRSEGVTRMFAAIQSEIQRRQRLNKDTKTKDIVEYQRQGLHEQGQPYPFLFIIIDEFAEMIAEQQDVRAQLETITRVGRAQGVHLILAAQRPSGVTDQMRANMKFRICLRVENVPDSRELLRRGDAALLPPGLPGRGYLQVGNEEIELIQVAYAGDSYTGAGPASQPVVWLRRGGDTQPPEARPLYRAVIDELGHLSADAGTPRQQAPWPPFLPERLWLSTPLLADDPAAEPITSDAYLGGDDVMQITLGQPPERPLTLNPAVDRWLSTQPGWAGAPDWRRYAMRPVIGLIDNPYDGCQRVLAVSLREGHVAVIGASGSGKSTLLRTMIASLAVTHSPEQLHVYLLDLSGRSLSVFHDLPHQGALITPDSEGYQEQVELMLRELDAEVDRRKASFGARDLYEHNASAPQAAEPALLVVIDNFYEFVETFGQQRDNVPRVLDLFIAVARRSREYGIHFVLTADRMGDVPGQVFNIFSERYVLRQLDAADYRPLLGGHAPEISEVPGRGYVRQDMKVLGFQTAVTAPHLRPDQRDTAEPESQREHDELAQLVAAIKAASEAQSRPQRLPTKIGPLDKSKLYRKLLAAVAGLPEDGGFWNAIAQHTAQCWKQSIAAPDYLEFLIGATSGNRPRQLRLETSRDGVHALVAGGTGSGKSELLMTMIVSLALRYDPSTLNFVLVDFKGGGAFQPFERLPHCVDLVTNLNVAKVRRMFIAINAEIDRRQAINGRHGAKDIVGLRKNAAAARDHYSFLCIIIDEYAEMISMNPDFRDSLERIARVGRSLGIHLVLAAQKPQGVTDQMRANIKLRLCLRVEDVDTSRELLRRSDAASLPSIPGRGYLQVGSEQIELVQVAFCGDPLKDSAATGGTRLPKFCEPTETGEPALFFEIAVRLAQLLAEHQPRQQAPWPPFLPERLALGTPLSPRYFSGAPPLLSPPFAAWADDPAAAWPRFDWASGHLRAPVGLVDDPYTGKQRPLAVDLSAAGSGHTVVFGGSTTGRTSFVRTLAAALAAAYPPDVLHIHALDLRGRSLRALEALPQVGSVLLSDEDGFEEQVLQLWRRLEEQVDHAKTLMGAQAGTLEEFNARRPGEALPVTVVVIDSIAEFLDAFAPANRAPQEDGAYERFFSLARQGRAFGIRFVITADRPGTLNSKLASLFTQRFALRLASSDDYASVVGSGADEPESVKGRGLVRLDDGEHPLVFQTALLLAPAAQEPPAGESGEAQTTPAQGGPTSEADLLALIGGRMRARGRPRHVPLKLSALKEEVSYWHLLGDTLEPMPGGQLDRLAALVQRDWDAHEGKARAGWLKTAVGLISGNHPRTLTFEASADGVHALVAGGTGSGKSELLMTLIVSLALRYSPSTLNFVLVDFKGGGAFQPFEHLPHCVDLVTNLNTAKVRRMFTAINAELNRRQERNTREGVDHIVSYRRRGLHLSGGPDAAYPFLFIIIDEYAEMISASPEFRDTLERIARVGRSVGVHLVLASQKPTGVSDQMRANIKLRLCLRVEDIDTSRELIRRPDAALLPSGMPGRGYIQSGNDPAELIQVAYLGGSQADDRANWQPWPGLPSIDGGGKLDLRLYEWAVALTRALWAERPVPRPWPTFLPARIGLASPAPPLLPAATAWAAEPSRGAWPKPAWDGDALTVTLGLVDQPEKASQAPLRLDLAAGHLAIGGDSASGKTTLLRTLVVAMAARLSPADLRIFILDMGGRSFENLRWLPHVGAVISPDDDQTFRERLRRLLDLLDATVERRQRLIAGRADTLFQFNAQFPAEAQPAILVVIDNIADLTANYENVVELLLVPLVRRALASGIVVAAAGNTRNNFRRLFDLSSQRLTLTQSDPTQYEMMVGRAPADLDALPGRGYVAIERRPFQFQAALPLEADDPGAAPPQREADPLRTLAGTMRAAASLAESADHTDALPLLDEAPPLAELLAAVRGSPRPPGHLVGLIGRGDQIDPAQADLGQRDPHRLEPALANLSRFGPHLEISGPPGSGKTTALRTLALALADRYPPGELGLVLVDVRRGRNLIHYGGARSLAELPQVVATITEPDQVKDLIANLRRAPASGPRRPVVLLIDNFDEFNDDLRERSTELARLVREQGGNGLHVVAAGIGDSGDLRRRIQSTGYRLALQTDLTSLSVVRSRRPAELRERVLGVGRGYLIKSGQELLVQVAAPEPQAGQGTPEEQIERAAAALDAIVGAICAAHPAPHSDGNGSAPPAPPAPAPAPRRNGAAERIAGLLRAAAAREGPAQADLTRLNGELTPEQWADPDALRAKLREAVAAIMANGDQDSDRRSFAKMSAEATPEGNLITTLEQYTR